MTPLATPRFFWLLFAALLVVLAGAAVPPLLPLGLAVDGLLLAAYAADRLLIPPRAMLQVTRDVADILSLGQWHWVELRIANAGARPVRVTLRDGIPLHFATEPEELHTTVPARSTQTLRYAVRSTERGPAQFGAVALRATGPFGLALRQQTFPQDREVRVYPDITAMTRYDLALRRGALEQFGVRPARARGEGLEFDRLREYVVGDDSRHIDWKATAKRARPIVREYETERSQQVVVLIDAGRLMTAKVGEFTKLDYAINAALLLAHVVIQRGDRVGVLAFSDQVDAYLPPRRGPAHLAQFLDLVAGIQPRLLESNYPAAFSYLALRNRRRTLVSVFTDLIDADASAVLLVQMRRLRPHHLPLCVTMRDADVDRVLRARVRTLRDTYRSLAAREVQDAYDTVITRLTRGGSLVVNVPADELSVATLNRYLEVKARGLL